MVSNLRIINHMKNSNVLTALFHRFPKRFPAILILMFFSGILEGFGIGIIIPIFEFFFEGREYTNASPVSHVFFGILESLRLPVNLKTLFGFSVVIFALKSGLKYLELFLMEQLVRFFTIDYSEQIFNRAIHLEWAIFQNEKCIGKVTSGSFLPSFKYSGGLALIDSINIKNSKLIEINIRGKLKKATIIPKPIYTSKSKT